MKTIFILPFFLVINNYAFCQNPFETDPLKAQFVTSDIPGFWSAFDKLNSEGGNPFRGYLEEGSDGLKDFIPYRIESPRNLKKTVKKRKTDYEAIREESYKVQQCTGEIRNYYTNFKKLYKDAVFPTTYFVIGAFNSGGTSSKNGLIIGVEMQKEIENIPYIVAHELIHFNQNYPKRKKTLLEQSIQEGSADFIGELISGKNSNELASVYGDANEEVLCSEFVEIMEDYNYHGWLYGSNGKKEGRPNDLGYWIGYKICKAYYANHPDKKQAIAGILNISDFKDFLTKSGYLAKYTND